MGPDLAEMNYLLEVLGLFVIQHQRQLHPSLGNFNADKSQETIGIVDL